MIKTITFAVIQSTTIFSCNNSDINNNKKENSTEVKSNDLYFEYTLDGKEMHVDAADILTTYRINNTEKIFSIHAGKEDGTTLLLTIPQDMSQPSITPSGSPDYKMNITQGSASLLNYPEKNYTSNSFNSTYPERTPVINESIIVTSSEK